MRREREGSSENPFELGVGIKTKLTNCLIDVGHDIDATRTVEIAKVDHYHNNCCYVFLGKEEDSDPTYVMKILDPQRGWDVNESDIRREHNVGAFASEIVPELAPRLFAGWCSANDGSPGVVLYSYLGEAATYVTEPEQTLEILSKLLPLLIKLHAGTSSTVFGKALMEDERKKEAYEQGHGMEIAKCLLNDIRRENLDPGGQIEMVIKDKWIPILDSEDRFSLCHNDVTMSNILVKDNTPIALIDWTYSRWGDPSSDLAYLAFWCISRGKGEDIRELYNLSFPIYNENGFHPERTLPFFLAYKCIEYGRFKGQDWVSLGQNLLSIGDSNEAISLIIESLKKELMI